jgi:prepilin-type N-terminal cleavage/methylation domain-containing protein
MRRRKRESSGFTLVEIMIALSLLGIGLLSLAAMQITAMQYGSRGRHLTKARSPRPAWRCSCGRAGRHRRPRGRRRSSRTKWSECEHGDEQAYGTSWQIANVDAGRTRSIDVRVLWTEPNRPTRQYVL